MLICPVIPAWTSDDIRFEGVIKEQSTGNPISHAKLLVMRWKITWRSPRSWRAGWERLPLSRTDENGFFELNLEADSEHIIIAYNDDPDTPGFDFVPSIKKILPSSYDNRQLKFSLWDGASVQVQEEAFFIESTSIPESTYEICDPITMEVIPPGEQAIQYGDGTDTINSYLGLDSNLVIIPAYTPFLLKVKSMITIGEKTLSKEFNVSLPNLDKGKSIEIELREFTLPSSILKVKSEANKVENLVSEKEDRGFFLAIERQKIAQISQLIDEADIYLKQGMFETSFTRIKEAYLEILIISDGLANMLSEATRAVSIIIGFFAVSATVIAHFLCDENNMKFLLSSIFYSFFLIALYLLHPGSKLLLVSNFAYTSFTYFLLVTSIITFLPRLLKTRISKGKVSLKNMTIPIFLLAKRNLRRRWFNFSLTLLSILILVSSFISLTSFTSGFSLTFEQIPSKTHYSRGIMVRTPNILPIKAVSPISGGTGAASSLPLDEALIEWLDNRPETILVAQKYENTPLRQYREIHIPFGYANNVPIFGVMGIMPSIEAEINSLDEALIEGKYLTDNDDNGVMISVVLAENLDKWIGDVIIIKIQQQILSFKIVGIFDDVALETKCDMDGESLLPQKIIELLRVDMEGPDQIIEGLSPCKAEEIIVITLNAASKIPGLWLSRLDIIVDNNLDLIEYSKMMVLNRGLRVWVSTDDGIHLAKLSSYFEGKGLPIFIPFLIVVLNVIFTMLNSFYERRKEVVIYSALGMNPYHISGIFLAEATIIAIIGGSLGYLFGLSTYNLIYTMTPALQVRQKVSAFWSFAALIISFSAVFVGSLAALKSSIVITPSLNRRWSLEKETGQHSTESYELNIPIRVTAEDVEEYFEHVVSALRSAIHAPINITSQIKVTIDESRGLVKVIEFIYKSRTQKIYVKNRLIINKDDKDLFTTKLLSVGNADGIEITGKFIRKVIMEWSLSKGK